MVLGGFSPAPLAPSGCVSPEGHEDDEEDEEDEAVLLWVKQER